VRVRGLTETKEGRLVVIGMVGGSLLLATAALNVVMGRAANATADEVRRSLRHDLSLVSDEEIADYPASSGEIEQMARSAVAGHQAQVLGTTQPDGDEVVVAVQAGWGWQMRCIRAELRGDATVLTYVDPRPC
jgi:hypothetical protein